MSERPTEAPNTEDTLEAETGICNLCCPSPLSCLFGTICFPMLCCSCLTVTEKTEAVLLVWGKYSGTVRTPGLIWYNPWGTSFKLASTARAVINIPTNKISDAHGNSILVSGVVTYYVVNSRNAVLEVDDYRSFLENQALSALKTVCGKYPYEADVQHDGAQELSLRGETDQVRSEMVAVLQKKVSVAGVVIDSFDLTDLSYAPEIAAAMLVRQQAHATIKARETIVAGAVGITSEAIIGLEAKGIILSDAEKSRLASNLLVTICGEGHIQPTVNLGA